MKIGVVIVSAGRGLRLGSIDKTTLKLKGKPLFFHTLKAFTTNPQIKQIVLVLPKKHLDYARRIIGKALVKGKEIVFAEGGALRQTSVLNGLRVLNDSITHVLVHDGARPFVSRDLIKRVIGGLKKERAVICALSASDTLKEINSKGLVSKTLDRKNKVLVQTPQGFRKDVLVTAYAKLSKKGSFDDAQLVEANGVRVKVVEGDICNFKITYPGDIKLAKALI